MLIPDGNQRTIKRYHRPSCLLRFLVDTHQWQADEGGEWATALLSTSWWPLENLERALICQSWRCGASMQHFTLMLTANKAERKRHVLNGLWWSVFVYVLCNDNIWWLLHMCHLECNYCKLLSGHRGIYVLFNSHWKGISLYVTKIIKALPRKVAMVTRSSLYAHLNLREKLRVLVCTVLKPADKMESFPFIHPFKWLT